MARQNEPTKPVPPIIYRPTKEEEKEIMGEEAPPVLMAPFVSAPVQYFRSAEPWAAIVTKVKPEGKVDLWLFRPDGVHQFLLDIPRRGGHIQSGCWEFAKELA